jgi:tetratricopeptide (TPR) repeat protein
MLLSLSTALVLFLLSGCTPALNDSGNAVASDPAADKPYSSLLDDPGSNALFQFGRANLLLGEGDVDGAIDALQKAIQLDPDAEDLRFMLAEIYSETGRLKEAKRTIEDILIRNPESVKAHQVLGSVALGEGQPDVAADHFRKVLELDPDNQLMALKLSIALVRLGETGQAIDELKQIIVKNPESRPARLTLARLYRDMKLNTLAEEQYRYLIEVLGDYGQACLDLGFMYEEQRDFEEALELFNQALQKNPHDLALRHHIARVYVSMQRYDDALRELELIVQLDAGDLDARRKIGLIYMEQERWDDAISLFRDLLEREPQLDPVRYYLGSALERKEQWQEAYEVFNTIPETSALYEDAVAHMGFLLMQMNRLDEAVALLESQMERSPGRPQVYYYLATIHLSQDQLNEALSVLERGVRQFPEDADLLYQQGITLERIGQHDQALEVMQRVVTLDENYTEALNFIAYAYAERDIRLEEALELAQRALSLKPAAHIHDTLGWIYYRLERYEEARQSVEEARQALPDDEVVLAHLAEIYLSLGETAKARELCHRLLEINPDNAAAKKLLEDLDAAH